MIASFVAAALTWTALVNVPDGDGPWIVAPMPGWAESEENGFLDRVRLLDAEGIEVPFHLIDPLALEDRDWLSAQVLNRSITSNGFDLDVLTPAGITVDAIRLGVRGEEGVFEATVTTGEGEDAATLVEGIRLGRLQDVSSLLLSLPPTDRTRLHVQLTTVLPGLEPESVGIRTTPVLRSASKATAIQMRLQPAAPEGDIDRWILTMPHPVARIDHVAVEIVQPQILRRRIRVQTWHETTTFQGWKQIGTAELIRVPLADGHTGLEQLEVDLPPAVYPRLRLEIERGAEAPIALSAVRARPAPRWILFARQTEVRGLQLARTDERRSFTLERGPIPIDPSMVTIASTGPRQEAEASLDESSGSKRNITVDLLFVAAALLLAFLAWRVLRRNATDVSAG